MPRERERNTSPRSESGGDFSRTTASDGSFIGGAGLLGSVGDIVGSGIGATFIGILDFGLLVMSLSIRIQEVITGADSILAVAEPRRVAALAQD